MTALHHLFVFEQANPFCEAILLGRAFRRGIIGSAGADEGARISGAHIQESMVSVVVSSPYKRPQEIPDDILQAGIAVGIAIPVAEHDVVFGAEIVVAAILEKARRFMNRP